MTLHLRGFLSRFSLGAYDNRCDHEPEGKEDEKSGERHKQTGRRTLLHRRPQAEAYGQDSRARDLDVFLEVGGSALELLDSRLGEPEVLGRGFGRSSRPGTLSPCVRRREGCRNRGMAGSGTRETGPLGEHSSARQSSP